jgi:hypothetical protein
LDADSKVLLLGQQIIHAFYIFIPLLSVLIVEKWKVKNIILEYSISFKGTNVKKLIQYVLATAILFPAIVLFLTYIFGNVFHMSSFGEIVLEDVPSSFYGMGLPGNAYLKFGILFLISLGMNFVGLIFKFISSFSGEIAWRGFLEKYIHYSRIKKTMLIGLIWGLWDIPLLILNPCRDNIMDYFYVFILKALLCVVCSFYFVNALKQTRSIFTSSIMQGLISSSTLIFLIHGDINFFIGDTQGLLGIASIMMINGIFSKISNRNFMRDKV